VQYVSYLRDSSHSLHNTLLPVFTPGQAVHYVVADADSRGITHASLPLGDLQSYNTNWCKHATIRAVKSMLVGSEWPTVKIR
jgi:hypothetical protein